MSENENPYSTPASQSGAVDEWEVRDGQLYCTQSVTLPRVCYATLGTNDVHPLDVRVKLTSAWVIAVWLALAVTMSNFSRIFPDLSLVAVSVGGVSLVVIAVTLGRVATTVVRLRFYESRETQRQRRRGTWMRRTLRISLILVGGGLFWMMIHSRVPALEVGAYGLAFAWVLLGGWLPGFLGWQDPLTLSAERAGSHFCVEGLSPAYAMALAELRNKDWSSGS